MPRLPNRTCSAVFDEVRARVKRRGESATTKTAYWPAHERLTIQVRALLGHARIDTTQVYTSIRPPQLKRAVSFYEEKALKMLSP